MIDRKTFFDAVRKDPFKSRLNPKQVEGMNGILDAFETHGDGRPKTLAYALATAYHEVGGRMVPVREGFAKSDAQARKVVARRAYGKPAGPYGHVYYGRGLVQLTWLDNYKRSSADAGTDLVKNPDAALDPIIGARILIKGLIDGRWNGKGKGIASYLPDKGPDDIKNARRTVNITDKWQPIGGYYRAFLSAVEAAWSAAETRPPPDIPVPLPPSKPAGGVSGGQAAGGGAVVVAGGVAVAVQSGIPWANIAIGLLIIGAIAGFVYFRFFRKR